MSDLMAPCSEDDPRMVAWKVYEATEEYAKTRRWALFNEHVDGSLWAAFIAGFDAARAAEKEKQ